MRHGYLKKMLGYLNLKETWVIFFVLGIIMMNYPFIHMFHAYQEIFGLPPLFLYLFVGWLISIFVIYLFIRAINVEDRDKKEDL